MNHDNRGRLAVDLGGAWRLYTTILPAGARALGTVTKNGYTGALIITSCGVLARLNAGAVVVLPQAKAQAAIDAACADAS